MVRTHFSLRSILNIKMQNNKKVEKKIFFCEFPHFPDFSGGWEGEIRVQRPKKHKGTNFQN